MATYLDSSNFFLLLKNEAGTVTTRIQHWDSLDFGVNGWGDFGDGKLVFPMDAPWLSQLPGSFHPYNAFYGYTLTMHARDGRRWHGAITDAQRDAVAGRGVYVWECETILSMVSRRRLDVTSSKAETVFNTNADLVIGTVYRAAINDTSLGGVVPTGYSPPSGTGARTDFHDWTIGAAALNSPAESSTNVNFTAQDGNTIIAIVEYAAEMGDCFVTCDEVAAVTYSIGVESPYLSGTAKDVPFSFRNGRLTATRGTYRTSTVVNKPQVKGGGTGASQTATWGDDSGSRGSYGITEASIPMPGGVTATVADTASKWAAALADPQETVEIEVNEGPNALWGADWDQRTQIIWRDDAAGVAGTAVIRGWRVKQSGRSPIEVSAVIGNVEFSEFQQVARFAPTRVMGGSPTLLRNRDG